MAQIVGTTISNYQIEFTYMVYERLPIDPFNVRTLFLRLNLFLKSFNFQNIISPFSITLWIFVVITTFGVSFAFFIIHKGSMKLLEIKNIKKV